MTPVDFLVSIYTDPTLPRAERVAAAIAACPYVHPRLAAHVVRHADPSGAPASTVTTINILSVAPGEFIDGEGVQIKYSDPPQLTAPDSGEGEAA